MQRFPWWVQLRFRVLIGFTCILIGAILHTNNTMHRILTEDLPQVQLEAMADRAVSLRTTLEREYTENGAFQLKLPEEQSLRFPLRLYDADGQMMDGAGDLPSQRSAVIQALADQPPPPMVVQVEDRRYSYQTLPLHFNGQVIGVLEMAEDLPPLERFQAKAQEELGTAGLLSLCTVVAVGMYLGGYLNTALTQIKQQTEAIVSGNFDRRIPVRSNDEIGAIGTYLNQMAEDLQRLAQTRNEFLSKVSHELRTPLTIAKGFSSTLRTGPMLPAQERTIEIIDNQIDDLTRLVNDLLDLSRRETGCMELRTNEIECGALVAEAIEHQRQLVRGQKVVLEARYHVAQHVSIRGDRQRLHQVLGNLIGNASRYAKRHIFVELDADETDAILRVRDDGPGIAPEDQVRIFEPFFQSRNGPRGRVGLGLTVAKELVMAHGGTIVVDSTPGNGTTFVIRLPRTDVPTDEARSSWSIFRTPAASKHEQNMRA
jgi:signal transduction histidine kinase